MTEQEGTTRSLLLDSLLELVPIERESTVRVLEIGTGRDGGASAAELADRLDGSVVSLSQDGHVIARARAVQAADPRLVFRRQVPLDAGYPARGPYDLVLSWQLMDDLPRPWVTQCSPSGHVLCPVFVHEPGTVGLVRVTVDQDRMPQNPVVALVESGGGIERRIVWEMRAATLNAFDRRYSISCER